MADSTFTPNLVDKLLDKLSTDDRYREEFIQDPGKALEQLGAPANFSCGPCMRPKNLASKEQIAKTRAALRAQLLGNSSHNVHTLEAASST